ncbi:MAG: hypothetical protein KC684_01785 [Candidatus Omnitrophica bacterium]|nr:hypothetical protein [Candidatus Omnitrophota bacterium]
MDKDYAFVMVIILPVLWIWNKHKTYISGYLWHFLYKMGVGTPENSL